MLQRNEYGIIIKDHGQDVPVAALWTVQFSLGPKGPPNQRPNKPDSGRAFAKGLRIANPKIA